MSQEHLKTMVYAKFGGQTKCIMGNVKMVNMGHRRVIFILINMYCFDINSICDDLLYEMI